MRKWIFVLLSFTLCASSLAVTNLTTLNEHGIGQWQAKEFSGKSIYTVGEYKGQMALKAISQNSASGLVLEKKIDLLNTPYLSWSWLVEKKLSNLDEITKNGDDFIARIYVVIDGGFFIWNTRSLNYVWSSNQAKDAVWDNAFAGSSVKMLAVRGVDSQSGVWYQEKRNVYDDLIATFGDKGSDKANQKAYQYIDIIAIMTDTDNCGRDAESYYGDVIFSDL